MKTLFSILLVIGVLNLASSLDRKTDCKCRQNIQSKIIGGHKSTSTYPWLLSLQIKEFDQLPKSMTKLAKEEYKISKHICGAILMNERWAMTAAHCVYFEELEGTNISAAYILRLGYGSNDLVDIYDNDKHIKIKKTIIHPEYSPLANVNDIALIELDEDVEFSPLIQPACIPSVMKLEFFGDQDLKVVGWGARKVLKVNHIMKTADKPQSSRHLMEALTKDVSKRSEICQGKILEQICVFNEKTHDSPCKGDSGGPMMVEKNGRSTVIGLTSWGKIMRTSFFFSKICAGDTAYTRIASYLDWIDSFLGNDYCIN